MITTPVDDITECNKCGGENDITHTKLMTADTECKGCGFDDSWSYGVFKSSNCKHHRIEDVKW